MKTGKGNTYITFAIALIGFAAIFGLSDFVNANRISLPESYSDADLSFQGKRLNGWALGSEGLLSDWYWMWSLQYIGAKIVNADQENLNLDDLRSLNPRLLHPLLANAAELDPRFMAVYSYGASVLPAIDADQAIALTEKGIERNPNAWRLYQYLGYIYWRLDRYEKAADVYERGSRIAGAPQFMLQMAAAMRTRGGSRETARELYKQMAAESEDQQSRGIAERRLMELDSLDDRDAINAILANARERSGRCPTSLAEILGELRFAKLPAGRAFLIDQKNNIVDAMGYPYVIDRETCTTGLNPGSGIPRS